MIRPRKPARRTRRVLLGSMLDQLEARALMAFAGGVDPTFGVGGLYSAAINPGVATGLADVTSVALETDGSIVEAGIAGKSGTTTFGLVHLTASGQLDTSFGVGGEADVTLPSTVTAPYSDTEGGPQPNLLIQSDGKIDLVGDIGPANTFSYTETLVEQFNANGTPDTTFGTDGQVILGPNGVAVGGAYFQYGALQADGQIVLAGIAPNPQSTNGSRAVAVLRLDANGQVDTTYGTNGLAIVYGATQAEITGPGGDSESPSGLAIQANGQAVVAASMDSGIDNGSENTVTYDSEVFRLNTDGTQDTSLSQAGLQSTTMTSTNQYGLALQPNGQILVAGKSSASTGSLPVVARLNPDGSLDATATLPAAFSSTDLGAIALEPDGDVLLSNRGSYALPTGYLGTTVKVARLTPSLIPDDTFGNAGISTIDVPVAPPAANQANSFTIADTLAITPIGQIVLAGVNDLVVANVGYFPQTNIVTRLNPTGTSAQSGDFTGDGVSDIAIYLPQYGAFAITDSSGKTAGQIVPFGIPGPGQTIPAPGNYYGTGQEDIAAYLPTYGVYAIKDPSGQTNGIDIPFGIAGAGQTIPAPGDYYGTGQDDIAVYLVQSGTFAILAPGLATGKLVPFGIPGAGQSIPVPGDYDGTGQDDIAVYMAQSGVWAIQDPSGKTNGEVIPFGMPGIGNSIPMPGDYDGSGKTELAVYIPSLGAFFYRPANGGPDVTIPFGTPGIGNTLPAPGDYDGSGKTEVAAYLPSLGIFAYRPAGGGADVYKSIGIPGPGQTIPVTTVVLSPFPGSGPGMGADAIEAPGVMGEADPLDFLILPESSAKKSKA